MMPLLNLQLQIPPIVAHLAAVAGQTEPASSISAAFYFSLPPLPFSLTYAHQLAMTATAAFQLAQALKIDFTMPMQAAQTLNSIAASVNANISMALPLPTLNMQMAMKFNPGALSLLLTALTTINNRFGINVFTPQGLIQLQAILAMPAFGPAPAASILGIQTNLAAQAVATMSAYAQMSMAAQLWGGWPKLQLVLQAIATMNLAIMPPRIGFALSLMLALQNVASGMSQIGLNPFSIDAQLQLRLMLAPILKLLATMPVPPAWTLPAFNFSASMQASMSATASASLSAVANLRLPDLGAFSVVGQLAAQAQLAPPSPCSQCAQASTQTSGTASFRS